MDYQDVDAAFEFEEAKHLINVYCIEVFEQGWIMLILPMSF